MTYRVTASAKDGSQTISWNVEAASAGAAAKAARKDAIEAFGEDFTLSLEELPEMPNPRFVRYDRG